MLRATGHARMVTRKRLSYHGTMHAHGPSRAASLLLPSYVRKANERTTSWESGLAKLSYPGRAEWTC